MARGEVMIVGGRVTSSSVAGGSRGAAAATAAAAAAAAADAVAIAGGELAPLDGLALEGAAARDKESTDSSAEQAIMTPAEVDARFDARVLAPLLAAAAAGSGDARCVNVCVRERAVCVRVRASSRGTSHIFFCRPRSRDVLRRW